MDESDIRLRDQMAIAIAQSVIEAQPRLKNLGGNVNESRTGTEYNSASSGTTYANEFYLGDDASYFKKLEGQMEMIADFSYKMADIMRKSRLKSFT